MKIYYTILLLLAKISIFAQSTIYSENFGTPTATTVVTSYSAYQNASPILYTGNADVRTTTPSNGYTGSSGNGSVFIAGTVTPAKFVMIEGIDTNNYINITMSFGHQKTTNASSNELTVEVSGDGTTWTPMNYTRATGNSSWVLITPTGIIPSTPNLRIKFTNPVTSNAGFRIDDVKITGTATSLSTTEITKKNSLSVYPTLVADGFLYIKSEKPADKEVKVYSSVGKLLLTDKVRDHINVTKLPKGVYHLEVKENDKAEIFKFIIK